MEELGIKLQTLARVAFPSIVGKEYDCLLKGSFFNGLLPKWQRKLGAPKPKESFEELYDRARTLERHDQQYSQFTVERKDPGGKKEKVTPKPATVGEPKVVQNDAKAPSNAPSQGQNQLVCYNCEKPGHIARNCRKPKQRPRFEATGRSAKPNVLITTIAEMMDSQLEQELASRRLFREEEQLKSANATCSAVTAVERAIGPTLTIELNMEGVNAIAVVDTASNSTIISCSLLHDIKRHLDSQGQPMPKLELPCVPLYGKEGKKGKPLDITAQLLLSFSCDGQRSQYPPLFNQKASSVV